MSDVAIRVEGLGKKYRLGAKQQSYGSLRESLASAADRPVRLARRLAGRGAAPSERKPEFWALKDVSFEVKHGEVLGIIGRNGAGKSTLLKLLSDITEPTAGRITMRGRVASLLEVGTGFHPELTGRENVFLNGAIVGMNMKEIQRKFDDIVSFAEVDGFIDTQVKHYSSGMYLRLAFSVSAHLDPDILIIDEVLAVGDQNFQRKCLGRMRDVTQAGRTVLFVSHQMAAVEHLCSRTIVLDRGKVIFAGDTPSALSTYTQIGLGDSVDHLLGERVHRTGSGRVRFTSCHLEDSRGREVGAARVGEDIYIVLGFDAEPGAKNVEVGISVHDDSERTLTVFYSSYVGQRFATVPSRGQFRCYIPNLPLVSRRYRLGARIMERGEEADWPRNGIGYLDVDGGDFYGTGHSGFGGNTSFHLHGHWELCGTPRANEH